MLNAAQIASIETKGCLVVAGVLDGKRLLAVRAEYTEIPDQLFEGWQAERLGPSQKGLDFGGKRLTKYPHIDIYSRQSNAPFCA